MKQLYINNGLKINRIMTETCKGIAIITNHFKEQPVQPKVVYANKYLLNLLGISLEEIVNKSPDKIFSNWNSDKFIQEIVACVEQKISWVGELELKTGKKASEKKKFIITPVYNINGEIIYYSCTTDVKKSRSSKKENDVCLDDFVSSLWEYQSHFKEVYELAPANLLRIDIDGNISYINKHAQDDFHLKNGDNVFNLITSGSSEVKKFFKDKKTIGKISKIDFDLNANNKIWTINCRFWPLVDEANQIIGYSISLSDITKKRVITQKLLALRGV